MTSAGTLVTVAGAQDRPVDLDRGLPGPADRFIAVSPQEQARPCEPVFDQGTGADSGGAASTGTGDRPTVLFADHDFKFIAQVIDRFRQSGYPVLVDQWRGHRKHDAARSQALIEQADVLFCEWFLGNAVWYARHKRPDQALVVRLHAQETRLPFLSEVDLARVDRVIFVGPHVRDEVVRDHGWPRRRPR